MPLKTVRRTRARGEGGGERSALSSHLFLFQNLSSIPEMKTQTDKADLKRAVVRSVRGRGRDCETHTVVMVKGPSPRGVFAPRQWPSKQPPTLKGGGVTGGHGHGAGFRCSPGLRLRAQLATRQTSPELTVRLCAIRCMRQNTDKIPEINSKIQGGGLLSEQSLRNRRPRLRHSLSSVDPLLRSSDLPGRLAWAGVCAENRGVGHLQGLVSEARERRANTQGPVITAEHADRAAETGDT